MSNLFKARASLAYKLMTEPKTKADKDAGELGQTAKSYVEEVWLKDNYGYSQFVMSDEMKKGLLVEQDSVGLVQSVLKGAFRIKNIESYENDYIKGTPDIILKLDGVVEDVKTSFDIRTFMNAELSSNYFCQGQCYMNLTGIKKYRLIYCLVDTPSEIVTNLKMRVYYQFGCNEENPDYQRQSQQIETNHKYSHIEPSKRLKIFEFDYDPDYIRKLYAQVEKARIYYNKITL